MTLLLALACHRPGPAGDDDDDDRTVTGATAETGHTGTVPSVLTDVSWALDDDQPSVVRVSWRQDFDTAVHLAYAFDGEVHTSPVRDLGPGAHEELLLGVPYGTDLTWEIRAGDDVLAAGAAQTAALPDEVPRASVLLLDAARVDPATPYVLVAVNVGEANATGTWTVLLDRLGRVSWAHRSPQQRNTMHPRVSWGGDAFLVDHSSFFSAFDGGAASRVLALKIDGTEVRSWDTPGQHHAFTDLPDGSLAYAQYQNEDGGHADDDAIVVIDPAGTPSQRFSCATFLAGLGEEGWCGSNTLSYDPQLDVFLFSLFTHDSVVEVDRATGAPNRWFGRIAGSWAFDPPSSQFDYQHGSVYLDDGHLLVSTHVSDTDDELVVREYALDDAAQTLRQVWSAGEGLGVVGHQKGEAHRLPGGNTLHNFGTHAVLREYTPEGDVVWDVRWELQQYQGDEAHQIGRSAPVGPDLYAFAPARP
ncbi:MAG: hypothetical protein R3F59_00975 [Myxococcota bacterium]